MAKKNTIPKFKGELVRDDKGDVVLTKEELKDKSFWEQVDYTRAPSHPLYRPFEGTEEEYFEAAKNYRENESKKGTMSGFKEKYGVLRKGTYFYGEHELNELYKINYDTKTKQYALNSLTSQKAALHRRDLARKMQHPGEYNLETGLWEKQRSGWNDPKPADPEKRKKWERHHNLMLDLLQPFYEGLDEKEQHLLTQFLLIKGWELGDSPQNLVDLYQVDHKALHRWLTDSMIQLGSRGHIPVGETGRQEKQNEPRVRTKLQEVDFTKWALSDRLTPALMYLEQIGTASQEKTRELLKAREEKEQRNWEISNALETTADVAMGLARRQGWKLVPGVGLGYHGLKAYGEARRGDLVGAGMQIGAGIAGEFGPWGEAASVGIHEAWRAREGMGAVDQLLQEQLGTNNKIKFPELKQLEQNRNKIFKVAEEGAKVLVQKEGAEIIEEGVKTFLPGQGFGN